MSATKLKTKWANTKNRPTTALMTVNGSYFPIPSLRCSAKKRRIIVLRHAWSLQDLMTDPHYYCYWEGVTCDAINNIIILDVSKRITNRTIPTGIAHASKTKIRGTIPTEIGFLKELVKFIACELFVS